MLMCADGCIKGVANSIPEMEAEMSYFINDNTSGELPVKIYNLENAGGNNFTNWMTHLNPQNDGWTHINGNKTDESNLLPYTLKDDNLLNLYGSNILDRTNIWKIDSTHKAHISNPAYDPNTGLPYYAPHDANYRPNQTVSKVIVKLQ